MNPVVLFGGLAAAALLLARRRPAPVAPAVPPRIKPRPFTPDQPATDIQPTGPDIVPPVVPAGDVIVTDPDILYNAKGVLWRWAHSPDGTAAPALSPDYGLAPEDNDPSWSARDGQELAAYLASSGLTPSGDPTRANLDLLGAWGNAHPDAPPAAPPAPVAMYLPIVDGDGGFSQLIGRHFAGVSWRAIANAQPDPQRRTRIYAGLLYGGQRIKIPAEFLSSYDQFRPLEDYATAVANDGKVSEE